MPTLAFLGNFGPPWSTENDYRLAFEALGWDVIRLQENKTSPAAVRAAALNSDLLLWTGTWDDAQPLDESISTFHACARLGIPTATVHLDTFVPVSRGGRKWWLHPMFSASTVFTASGDDEGYWNMRGIRHVWLPPGVRHTVVENCTDSLPVDPRYVCDVAFVGSDGHGYHEDEWPYRRELVDRLEAMCRRNGWSFRNPGGREPKIERQHMAAFYASAKVTVGDSLCPKREASRYWSDRVPEATGRRGYLIMPFIDELAKTYGSMPMYEWGNWASLEDEISVGLMLDDEDRGLVTDACYRVTAESGTYVHRAQTILETLGVA